MYLTLKLYNVSMEKALLEELIHEGLSANKIAKKQGVSLATVRYWLKKHGLKTGYQSIRERTFYHMSPEERIQHDKQRRKAYYEANKKKMNTNSARRQYERGLARKKEVMSLLNLTGCALCGYNKCLSALEFHHVYGKEFHLDKRTLSNRTLDVVMKEAKKCILLCSNCHREYHHGIYSDELMYSLLSTQP